MSTSDEHAAVIARLEAMLATERQRAVAGLRLAEERWARALAGLGDAEDLVVAVRALVERGLSRDGISPIVGHLAAAEKWQWEIGTWASGSGEGLASMAEVRSLQLAQAWLLSIGDADARNRAQQLLDDVAGDPNDVAARQRRHVDELRRRLAKPGLGG